MCLSVYIIYVFCLFLYSHKGQGVSLQDELRLEHLQLLWERFSRPLTSATGTKPVRRPLGTSIRPGDEPVTPHPRPHRGRESGTGGGSSLGGSMGLEEFRAALGTLPDSEGWISEMEELFHEACGQSHLLNVVTRPNQLMKM